MATPGHKTRAVLVWATAMATLVAALPSHDRADTCHRVGQLLVAPACCCDAECAAGFAACEDGPVREIDRAAGRVLAAAKKSAAAKFFPPLPVRLGHAPSLTGHGVGQPSVAAPPADLVILLRHILI
jgi:hypothetical protein